MECDKIVKLTYTGENMNNILKQLTEIEGELTKPFPYRDTDQIQEDFRVDFSKLSDDENWLTSDFNDYSTNIAGTLSYVLLGKTNKIPQAQVEMLNKSFFELFNQYKFFEDQIESYNDFYKEYKTFEHTRKLLLQLLSK